MPCWYPKLVSATLGYSITHTHFSVASRTTNCDLDSARMGRKTLPSPIRRLEQLPLQRFDIRIILRSCRYTGQ